MSVEKVNSQMSRGMTVSALIAELQRFDANDVVVFQYPAGDYWRTQLVSVITEVGENSVKWSEYHRTLEIADEDYCHPEDEDLREVVMLY